MVGRTISHYRITEKLGEGGMGVVYKAEDTKLKRTVALKFLAAHLLNDKEIKVRFQREAEAAAALTHSNIAVIYDIDESDGQSFIAMEFVEGRTVSEKVAERPLKLDEALDIAMQATQGLQAAHERGVVHRDIKSANLMVTPQGQVKIMDFGLAQLAERSKLTETTAILGTPSYMSPEQAVGDKTDRRTDIWSLGVVLYEMVAGRLPFAGERQEAVLYGISNQEPEPVTALRAGLPMELEWIVGKALAKDREERYQHAEDLLVDFRSLQKKLSTGKTTIVGSGVQGTHPGAAPIGTPETAKRHSSERKLVAAVAFLALTTAVFAVLWLRSPLPIAQLPHRTFTLSTESPAFWPSISPDGRYIAYLTRTSRAEPTLWVHDLSQDELRVLAGPEQGVWDIKPFWSPDSKSVLFRAGQRLRRISVLGGSAVSVVEKLPDQTIGPFGGAYSPDGASIVISHSEGLFEVPAQGGEPRLLIESSAETRPVWPRFLPGDDKSRKLLYVVADRNSQEGQIVAHDLNGGHPEELVSGTLPAYDPSGHIIYRIGESPEIWGIPFSIDTLKTTGDPFPIRKDASRASVGLDGTLLYQQGGTALIRPAEQLVWRDREGEILEHIGQHQRVMRYPALSPDEKQVAVQAFEGVPGPSDIWIHEVDRPVKTRLTATPGLGLTHREVWPTWSPRGDRIAYSFRDPRDVLVTRADGTGQPEPLIESDGADYLTHWSSDEKTLFFQRGQTKERQQIFDLWYLKRRGDGSGYQQVSFLQTPSSESNAYLSPNGRFVAYVSDESGQQEVYVRSFPSGTGKRLISAGGGTQPRWRADGKELYYVRGRTLMAMPVETSPDLKLGAASPLFSSAGLPWTPAQAVRYDVSRDGERFVVVESLEQGSKTIRLVENWYEEFRDREQDYGMHP